MDSREDSSTAVEKLRDLSLVREDLPFFLQQKDCVFPIPCNFHHVIHTIKRLLSKPISNFLFG
jgi:hypothetical protein